MKYYYYIFISFLFVGCSGNTDQSDAYGNFEAEEVFIAGETTGKLLQLNFALGDQIGEGDLIAIIDTSQLFFQKGQLKASMSALRQKLQNVPVQLNVLHQRRDVLLKEYERVQKLFDQGAATQKQVDDLSGELEVLKKQVLALESQLSTQNRAILAELKPIEWKLKTLEDLIEKSLVKSPLTGVVLSKYKSQGEMALAGQPIVKIADISALTLRAYISGDQIAVLKIGDEVDVFIDSQSDEMAKYNGTVTWVSEKAEFTPKAIQTRSERVNLVYATKINVLNDGSLKIGMPAEVRFRNESNSN